MQLLSAEALQTKPNVSEQMLLIPLHQHSPVSQMSSLNEQLLCTFSSCAVGHPRFECFKNIHGSCSEAQVKGFCSAMWHWEALVQRWTVGWVWGAF